MTHRGVKKRGKKRRCQPDGDVTTLLAEVCRRQSEARAAWIDSFLAERARWLGISVEELARRYDLQFQTQPDGNESFWLAPKETR